MEDDGEGGIIARNCLNTTVHIYVRKGQDGVWGYMGDLEAGGKWELYAENLEDICPTFPEHAPILVPEDVVMFHGMCQHWMKGRNRYQPITFNIVLPRGMYFGRTAFLLALNRANENTHQGPRGGVYQRFAPSGNSIAIRGDTNRLNSTCELRSCFFEGQSAWTYKVHHKTVVRLPNMSLVLTS